MGEQIYKVRDPEGNIREIKGPEGASDDEVIQQAKNLFQSTPGGAAVGNPNLERYGAKAMRSSGNLDPLLAIGGAGAVGGALGAFSKELLGGAGNVIGALPYPAARTVGGFLKGASQVIGSGGRAVPAIAGTISGLAGETAGQAAEAAGAGPVTAEVARIVGGGITPEVITLGKEVLSKYVKTPALSLMSKLKKETAISILEKFDKAPNSLTDQERQFLESEISALRGGPKSDDPLEKVGSIMGDEGKRLLDTADQNMIAAQAQASGMKLPPGAEMADVGGSLQNTINTRYKGALDARRAEYAKNEQARDAVVSKRESVGQFVNSTPEYQSLVSELREQLKPGARSESVQAGIKKVLADLESFGTTPASNQLSEQGDFLVSKPASKGPMSFQALDDVRRKLGDAFRGKPAEGYDAIGEQSAKDLYGKVSNIQKKYAGEAQAKLLDDYAERTEGLNIFSSKYGKKATALDQYREDTFANDPSGLPSAYFKTRASVQALKELTGNAAQVNHAALEYANKQLAGKDADGVRKWMSANSEWLAETGPTRTLIDRYATKLEGVERSLKNAEDFARQAARDSAMLTRNSLPAQRAVDLIKSGDTELWGKVIPAIQQSPQAKKQMVDAVRQVVADQATASATTNLFSRNIRPFIEGSGIGTKAEMDFIAQKLASIQEMKVPEYEKLGIAKRVILQATGGWAASAAGRGAVWAKEKVVPE